MFVVLVGLLGVTSMFNNGMKARVLAQEIVLSQELANMWADWVRFRLNDSPKASGPYFLKSSDLSVGQNGDFFSGAATGNFGADPTPLPTVGKKVYSGFMWQIGTGDPTRNIPGTTPANSFKPQWVNMGAKDLTPTGGNLHDWDQGLVVPIIPGAMGAAPKGLTQVDLMIIRGGRPYHFTYVFSGIGMRY